MANRLDTELRITAKTDGLNHVKQLRDELASSGNATDVFDARINKLEQSWDELNPRERAQQMRQLRDAMGKALDAKAPEEYADAVKYAGRETRELGSAAQQTTSTFVRLKSAALKFGAAIAGVFAAHKIAGFFSSAVHGAAGFEEQLDKVAAVSGATAEEMRRIEAVSKQLGASTRYTATEAAQGFETLARAGLNARESIEALPSVLALAQGNGIGLADAASFVTKAIAGMNLTISDSGRVADVLAKAAASANTDVTGLGQALSYAAPSASSLGVSLEETVAIIGKFADAGIDASRAGTALNSIMSQFANPASKFREELAAAGIYTNDFGEALQQLAAKGKAGEKAIFAVGQEAGPALKALLAQGMPALDELVQKLKDSEGAAQEMAKTMDDNLPGAIRGLGSAWDGLKTRLVQPLLEPIQAQISKLTASIRQATDGGAIDRFASGLVDVFQAAASGVGVLIKYSGTIATLAGSMVAAKAAVAAKVVALRTYAAAAGAASKTILALKTAANAANSPISALKIGFTGLGAAIKSLGTLGIAAGVTGAIELYRALKSNVDDVRESYRNAIGTWAQAEIAQYRLNSALQSGMDVQSEYVQAQQSALRSELDAIDARIAGFEAQKKAAEERFFVDEKAIEAANQAIAAEQQRRDSIQQTVDQIEQLITAQQAAAKAEAEAAQAREFSKSGWEKIAAGIDDANKAMQQIPERSKQIIDGLNDLGKSANETGENLALAFRVGIADIETQEALRVVSQQLRALAADGKITAEQFEALSATIKERMDELPPAITEGAVALQKLGLEAQQMTKGIGKSAQEAINNFKTASKEFGTDAERMADIFNAAAKKVSNPQEWAALVEALRKAGERAGLTADEINRIIDSSKQVASAASAAFAKIGVDIDTANQGISASNRQMIANFVDGMSKAKDEGIKTANIVQASFEKMTSNLQTPAEFKALYDSLRQTGAISQLTAEQLRYLQAGMQGGAEAAQALTNALTYSTQAKQQDADAARANADADKEAADAKNKYAQSAEAAAKADADAADAKQQAATASYQLYDATGLSADAIDKLTTKTTALNLAMAAAFADMSLGAAEQTRRISAEIEEYTQSITAAQDATARLYELTDAGTVTMYDVAQAAQAARGGIEALDSTTLANLNSAIDAARQKLADMKQEAEDTRASLEAQLASLRGDDSVARALEEQRKLRELNLKLQDAEAKGQREIAQEYREAIKLQEQVFAEERRQQAARKEEEKRRKEESAQRRGNTTTATSRQTNSSSDIDADKVVGAIDERIKKSYEQGFKDGKTAFADELHKAAKRRPT